MTTGAERLAELAARRKSVVLAYIVVLFVLLPAAGVVMLG